MSPENVPFQAVLTCLWRDHLYFQKRLCGCTHPSKCYHGYLQKTRIRARLCVCSGKQKFLPMRVLGVFLFVACVVRCVVGTYVHAVVAVRLPHISANTVQKTYNDLLRYSIVPAQKTRLHYCFGGVYVPCRSRFRNSQPAPWSEVWYREDYGPCAKMTRKYRTLFIVPSLRANGTSSKATKLFRMK